MDSSLIDLQVKRKQILQELQVTRSKLYFVNGTRSAIQIEASSPRKYYNIHGTDQENNAAVQELKRQLKSEQNKNRRLEEKEKATDSRITELEYMLASKQRSENDLKAKLEVTRNELLSRQEESKEAATLRAKAANQEANEKQIATLKAEKDIMSEEIQRLRRFQETWQDLVRTIDEAAKIDKVCLVSARGCSVLSMEELRDEIMKTISFTDLEDAEETEGDAEENSGDNNLQDL